MGEIPGKCSGIRGLGRAKTHKGQWGEGEVTGEVSSANPSELPTLCCQALLSATACDHFVFPPFSVSWCHLPPCLPNCHDVASPSLPSCLSNAVGMSPNCSLAAIYQGPSSRQVEPRLLWALCLAAGTRLCPTHTVSVGPRPCSAQSQSWLVCRFG